MKEKPVFGVYAGRVRLSLSNTRCLTYKAGIVIGPLDKRGLPKIEAHLINYIGKIYGVKAVFEIEKFLRKFRKFDTEEELITQIKKDLEICSQA